MVLGGDSASQLRVFQVVTGNGRTCQTPGYPSALLGLVTLSFCLCLELYRSTTIHPFLKFVTCNILGLEQMSFYSRNNWLFIPVLCTKRTRRNLKQTIPCFYVSYLCKDMLRKQPFVETDINHRKANGSHFNAICTKCNSVQGSAIP